MDSSQGSEVSGNDDTQSNAAKLSRSEEPWSRETSIQIKNQPEDFQVIELWSDCSSVNMMKSQVGPCSDKGGPMRKSFSNLNDSQIKALVGKKNENKRLDCRVAFMQGRNYSDADRWKFLRNEFGASEVSKLCDAMAGYIPSKEEGREDISSPIWHSKTAISNKQMRSRINGALLMVVTSHGLEICVVSEEYHKFLPIDKRRDVFAEATYQFNHHHIQVNGSILVCESRLYCRLIRAGVPEIQSKEVLMFFATGPHQPDKYIEFHLPKNITSLSQARGLTSRISSCSRAICCVVDFKSKNTMKFSFKPKKTRKADYYSVFSVRKKNIEGKGAVRLLAKLLNIDATDIGYAGTKDKRAVSLQKFSARGVTPKMICKASTRLKDSLDSDRLMIVGTDNVHVRDTGLRLGEHGGNRFIIRMICRPSVSQKLMQESFEELKRQEIRFAKPMPWDNNALESLRTLTHELRRQSKRHGQASYSRLTELVCQLALKAAHSLTSHPKSSTVSELDLKCVRKQRSNYSTKPYLLEDLVVPMPGYRSLASEDTRSSQAGQIVLRILEKDGVSPLDFKTNCANVRHKGAFRRAFAFPRNFEIIRINAGKENKCVKSREYKQQIFQRPLLGVGEVDKEVEILITFDLGVSVYATALLREMCKCRVVGVR
eukprot:jgi/Bigna1/125753/aug1.1_g461